jgi:hypothetical protein
MTDRELLEAAARAAGIKALRDPNGMLRNCTGMHPDQNIFSAPYWNPLTDDGDALRLAVALRINIEPQKTLAGQPVGWNVWPTGRGDCGIVEDSNDASALRRAIVRAAAAMAQAHQ